MPDLPTAIRGAQGAGDRHVSEELFRVDTVTKRFGSIEPISNLSVALRPATIAGLSFRCRLAGLRVVGLAAFAAVPSLIVLALHSARPPADTLANAALDLFPSLTLPIVVMGIVLVISIAQFRNEIVNETLVDLSDRSIRRPTIVAGNYLGASLNPGVPASLLPLAIAAAFRHFEAAPGRTPAQANDAGTGRGARRGLRAGRHAHRLALRVDHAEDPAPDDQKEAEPGQDKEGLEVALVRGETPPPTGLTHRRGAEEKADEGEQCADAGHQEAEVEPRRHLHRHRRSDPRRGRGTCGGRPRARWDPR